ncbi:unnamed protein product [Dracunculus medinensis]|uniref:Reverse transcriptase domain-containing protein n=1 Tax=Dracunculus medinensis TaxID=318479 RepID=A0A0N4UEP5_DRAME|nr:unnamed protein product [Dracunculus medinensis]
MCPNQTDHVMVMECYGVPEKIVRLIKAFYERTSMQICLYGELTESFKIKTGVRQGCIISPTIFNYAIDWVMDTAYRHSRSIQISPKRFTDLEYVGDVVLFADEI